MRSRIYIVPRNTFELYLNNDIQHRVEISAASENKKILYGFLLYKESI